MPPVLSIDPRLAKFLGKIISGGKPMSAAANDDEIIGRLRLGVAPGGGPALMPTQGFFDDAKTGIAHGTPNDWPPIVCPATTGPTIVLRGNMTGILPPPIVVSDINLFISDIF